MLIIVSEKKIKLPGKPHSNVILQNKQNLSSPTLNTAEIASD